VSINCPPKKDAQLYHIRIRANRKEKNSLQLTILTNTTLEVMMSWFKKIGSLLAPKGNAEDKTYWIYVQCKSCGEKIRTRVNLYNDLSIQYGEGGQQDTYLCRKTIMGKARCFQRLEVTLSFNAQRQLIDQQIKGGEFIKAEDN
jgi:hypothetical protein